VSFRSLSNFPYPEEPAGAGGFRPDLVPPGKSDPHIPPKIRQLHDRDVITMGYMLPLTRTVDNRVSAFLLMRDQSLCCFGRMPRVNDYIAVKMEGDSSAPAVEDEPILVSGKLQVGAVVEEGMILGIYTMAGKRVEARSDLKSR
jgi:hypothetical protein